MKKKRATFNLSEQLLRSLDSLPRTILPNKSELVENLLEKWVEEKKSTIYVEKEMSGNERQ